MLIKHVIVYLYLSRNQLLYSLLFYLIHSYLVFLAAHQYVQCEIKINSTITNHNIVRRGENVTFTCIVRGSSTMAWISPQYIGSTDQLEFSVLSSPGSVRRRYNTTAELISVSTEAEVELISTLHIFVQPEFSMSRVTCRSVGTGELSSIDFTFSGML